MTTTQAVLVAMSPLIPRKGPEARKKALERVESDLADVAGAKTQPDTKSSMVSALLETVNGEIKSKSTQPKPPSPQKRSPIRESPSAQRPIRQSPSRRQHGSSPLAKKSTGVRTAGESDAGISFGDKASSDYGDDDFDDETLLGLDASIPVQEDDSTMVVSVDELNHQPQPPPKVADDEFGDFDDDFLDGAEELVAEVEAKHASQNPFHGQQHKSANAWIDDNAYGDDFDDADFDAVGLAATQATAQPFSTNPRADSAQILLVQAERTNAVKTVHLRNDWYDETEASPKAYVHIIGNFESSGRCIIDNNHNTLILHPDQLVSSTVVADSFTCARRAVLQDRVKATSESTPPNTSGLPMYGLKGNIDATVQVTMRDGKKSQTLTVPFEVKTGKNATSNHQAQTMLYNLLLSDRYDLEIVYGVLYYMETSQTLRIPAIRCDLQHMIMQRNKLVLCPRHRASSITSWPTAVTVRPLGWASILDELVKHLTPTHRDFFLKWEDLLTKEEKESQKLRRELWTMVSTEREKLGRCFANVIIEEGSASEDKQQVKINRFSYTFIKEELGTRVSLSWTRSFLSENPLWYRDEQGHFALALGFVTAVKKQRISVAVDRRLHNARIRQPGFNEVDNQVFASIMEVAPEGARAEQGQGKIKEAPIRYRLDKDEFSNGMATVLLTSYTHTAVDNILLKLKDDKIPILRLGTPAKVHPEVQNFATLANERKKSFEEIRSAWHDTPIVATTCLTISHPVFNERTFDYCIVDEASQITLPICLGPIRMARTFVLVGDHNQLPPLVQNEEARLGGLDISLFKLLSDTHPQSVVNLEHQYRMSEDIMTLSNTLIYNGRLKCGTESLRHAELHVPNMDALRARHFDAASFISHSQSQSKQNLSPSKPRPTTFCPASRLGSCWLTDLIHPSARVRLVNTDALLPHSLEQAKGNRIVNPCEARAVAQLVDALLAVGVPPSEIGVVTHYRSQLALLKHTLLRSSSGAGGAARDVEMHTADRFQGRDKSVVILSLVRSNEQCAIGELLKDWRRINVAFTRAKTKLLVVGSRSTLGRCGVGEMLARFVGLMEEREWVYDLDAGALDAHLFSEDGGATQVTVSGSATAGRGAAAAAAAVDDDVGEDAFKGFAPRKGLLFPPRGEGGAVKGKENKPLSQKGRTVEPKKAARIGERAMLRGKPVLRDILNDMMDGGY
ncbi:hypothetical protein CHGG_08983 [Chaetomium globosum CBS 148.51]|uniref:DNA replication ATP-dependent helicase/nuclease n=1 Tax=Chaetomium globosum (strain ATCC 6205 / CBS 148.51 / DSM 1962 / NBRC 6347 / NRRL 1970) TaxID=306901 RepID=Q2GSS1_CHAGB|nr:uncharacterized protein CHGG_08983 [Chaetomium globosum CBS 148.51]EAQ84969.1 hypothetical protein CHGG_08983 [Chaetomium globosum CBS 148.51]